MYREVTMVEITEVLRLWRDGLPKKRIAARVGLDPKTVRRYLTTAEAAGLPRDGGALTEAQVRDVLLALHPAGGRPRGDGWARCREQQATIQLWLQQHSADENSQATRPTGRRDHVRDAAPLRGRRAQFRPRVDDDPGRRWRAG